MAGNNRRYPRPLFLPWLIEQIDSNNYEGLYWVDEKHTKFHIKWKHKSRNDYNPKDSELFKAWAIEGGKYSEQCEDPTLWKTNFRCALNSITVNKKKVITIVVDKSLDLHDPHKVFQINCPQDSAVAASSYFLENHNGLNSEEHNDDENLRISPDHIQTVFKSAMPQPVCLMDQRPIEEKMQGMSLRNHLPETQLPEMLLSSNHQNGHNVCPFQRSGMSGPGNVSKENKYHPMETQRPLTEYGTLQNGISMPDAFYPQAPSPQFPGQTHCPVNTFLLTLEVTVLYRGKTMMQQQVNSPCLLSYNAESDLSFNYNSAVSFPSPESLPDQKQVQYTTKLLQNVEPGLLLEVDQETHKIYATRMGKCKVFWAFSKQLENPAQDPESNMLQREERTQIFSFNQFLMELRDYKAGRQKSPDYTLYLCFGQSFSEQRARIERKLILVKIVPQFCAQVHDLIQREGASSLNSESLSLQISNSSNNSLYELIDSCDLMDIDFSQFVGLLSR
uniref:Interferon regulatory factor 7 isoform X2 n=1 Tax=Geotrypetes seraphini TaxID=260995 RepID=A0A6P8PJF7_GEOSA|nr:interferon regulatory factor 7 isoform X2 [Geotrypetes seraphini]